MRSIRGAIENTVSISLFNRGLAGKIFEEVRMSGAKVVMKNNSAECVILSTDEYLSLLDRLAEAEAMVEAVERLKTVDVSSLLTSEQLAAKTELDIDYVNTVGGVDFE